MRPAALYGYSIAGYIAWLVDRLLAREAWRPHRVIAIDAHPMHDRSEADRQRIDALLDGASAPSAPMLLVHRSAPAPFRLGGEPVARWSALGVACHCVALPTLSHQDLWKPAAHQAVPELLRDYMDGLLARPSAAHPAAVVDEPGGRLYRMLAAGEPPTQESLLAALGDPNATVDHTALQALLVLVLSSQDADLAWRAVEELAARHPRDRGVHYARVGLLSLRGQPEAAAQAAEGWCRQAWEDPEMRRRAAPVRPVSWSWAERAEAPIGSLQILDRALECLAVGGGGSAALPWPPGLTPRRSPPP